MRFKPTNSSIYSEVFIYSDQPVTCPYCSKRTEILLDMFQTTAVLQVHFCNHCDTEFVIQQDDDFNYSNIA